MAVAAATDMYKKSSLIKSIPRHASPEGEGTNWGMLTIFAVLFAARQRGVEDGAATPTEGVYAHEIAGCFAQLCQLLRQQGGAYSQRSPKWVTGFGDLERSQ